jgi:phosphoenolpyruvate-protein kinase (PTS system EI component)
LTILKKILNKFIIKQDLSNYYNIIYGKVIYQGVVVAPIYKAKLDISTYKVDIEFKEVIDICINELDVLYKDSKYKFYLTQKELLDKDNIKSLTNLDEFNRYIKEHIQSLTSNIFNSSRCDYLDIQKRVFFHLGQKSSIIFPNEPSILVSDDILPSDILLFKDNNIVGVVLKKASKNANSSKLLNKMKIPTMLIRDNINNVNMALLDASLDGGLIENPLDRDIQFAKSKNILSLSNIDNKFINSNKILKSKKLSIDEETKIYKNLFRTSNSLYIQTLDIRLFDNDTEKFEQNIKAILRASRGLEINIAFSMVSTPNEFKDMKNILLNIGKKYKLDTQNIKLGIIIEVPSVIFFIEKFNTLVDFYHIDREILSQNLFLTKEEVNISSVEVSYIINLIEEKIKVRLI